MQSLWIRHQPQIRTDEFEEGGRYDVVVAGAGLTGLVTAVLLSRARLQVAVIEANEVGSGTTGHTTAKLSLLQGTTLQQIRRRHSAAVVRAYIEGNREGQAWLLRYLEEHGIDYQRAAAYTYTVNEQSLDKLRVEAEVSAAAGLEVEQLGAEQVPLPFPVAGALRLRDQAQIDPMLVMAALAAELRERGGKIFEHTRLLNVGNGAPIKLHTVPGELLADQLVLATGTPVLDRGGHFARLEPSRSYAVSYRIGTGQEPPQGMFLSVDSPTRSIRTAPHDGGVLLLGGNGHPVGMGEPGQALHELEQWARDTFNVGERTDAWSAQDYRAAGDLPIVGKMPRSGGNIHVATGFNKWGMSNAVAAGLRISASLLGGQLPWAEKIQTQGAWPGAWADTLQLNAKVLQRLVTGWAAAMTGTEQGGSGEAAPHVRREGLRPVARSYEGTEECRVSGVCTHLGGILKWNDAERTWDCPLHGSRFTAQGRRIEGPATRDLQRLHGPNGHASSH